MNSPPTCRSKTEVVIRIITGTAPWEREREGGKGGRVREGEGQRA